MMTDSVNLFSKGETGGVFLDISSSSKGKKKKSKKGDGSSSRGRKASFRKESKKASSEESSGVRTKFQLESLARELELLQIDNRKLRDLVASRIVPIERAERVIRESRAPEVDFTPPDDQVKVTKPHRKGRFQRLLRTLGKWASPRPSTPKHKPTASPPTVATKSP